MIFLDDLFRSEALSHIFSDTEYLQSLLHFEAALARAEAQTGIIPEAAARAIVAKCQSCFVRSESHRRRRRTCRQCGDSRYKAIDRTRGQRR